MHKVKIVFVKSYFDLKAKPLELNSDGQSEDNDWVFDGELELLTRPKHSIKLKMFWDNRANFLSTFSGALTYYSGKKLQWMKILPDDKDSALCNVDIVESTITGYSDFRDKTTNRDCREMTLSRIKCSFVDEGMILDRNEFFLYDNACIQVNKLYAHNPIKLSWIDDWDYSPTHRFKDGFKLGEIRYNLNFDLKLIERGLYNKVIIEKYPRIVIDKCDLHEDRIRDYANLICQLLSFYCHERIDYKYYEIYTKDKRTVEIKEENENLKQAKDGIFWLDFKRNVNNLILNVNVESVLNNLEFISKIIDKYIIASNSDGEARFMLLYNILEQIRTQSGIKISDQYAFNIARKEINELIRASLKNISEKIKDDDEKKFFEKSIDGKISQMKYKTMTNQFEDFFREYNLDPSQFQLNFARLIDIRDQFFHGNHLDNDLKAELDRINEYRQLPKFVGSAILKYLGVDDIKNIKLLPD